MATNNAINANQTLDTAASPTFNGLTLTTCTITGSGLAPATIQSSDTGASAAVVDLYRSSNSPAASDILFRLAFNGISSALNKVLYANITASIISTTNGVEKGQLALNTIASGSTTNQLICLDTGCQVRGNNANTAPSTGFIGELLATNVAAASGIALTNNTSAEVCNVVLTAGTWKIWGLITLTGITTGTWTATGVNATTATFTTENIDYSGHNLTTTSNNDVSLATPFQIITTSGATYYLNVKSAFTVSSSPKAYGKIQALRIA